MPTPAAQEPGGTVEQYHERLREHDGRSPTFTPLGMLVQMLPTPRSSDGPKGGPRQTGDGLQPAVRHLPTPRAGGQRTSRGALTGSSPSADGHWSAPSLEQAVELAQDQLPREYESWDEVQGWHGRYIGVGEDWPEDWLDEVKANQPPRNLPTPMAGDAKGARNSTATRHREPPTGVHAGDTLSDVAYADRWGEYAPAIARWEAALGRPAPDPTDDKGRLSPDFVAWMMGWPDGWLDGLGLSRSQKLKILGNGVVPQQAVAAYSGLLECVEVAA